MENVKNNAHATFQERLSKLLESPDVSQKKLADYVGVTRQAIGQWKDGKTLPDVLSFQKIAKFFKVSYEYLLGETPDECKEPENVDINKKLGLSDEAVQNLETIFNFAPNFISLQYNPFMILLNALLSNSALHEIILEMSILSIAMSNKNYAAMSLPELMNQLLLNPASENSVPLKTVEEYVKSQNDIYSYKYQIEEKFKKMYLSAIEQLFKKEASDNGKHNTPNQ